MATTHHYCTLFDHRFLARALALYRSLERCDEDFMLRAVCMDRVSAALLQRLPLPRLRVVPIEQIERADPTLLAVRPSRSSWEYCWTATPAICRYFLRSEPQLTTITYVDADLHFSSSPQPLFEELGDDAILLIPHRGTPETDEAFGIYNVGWVTFRNDDRGRAVVDWWRERCLEWCYDPTEDGRFGDQKYLDDWPSRFPGVRVSRHLAAGLGPWNEAGQALSPPSHDGPPVVDGEPLLFFHHSGLRIQRVSRIGIRLARWTGELELFRGKAQVLFALEKDPSDLALDLVWRPYLAALTDALAELADSGAPTTLCIDASSHRLVLWSYIKRRVPWLVAGYRRLPLAVQHRMWAWFSAP